MATAEFESEMDRLREAFGEDYVCEGESGGGCDYLEVGLGGYERRRAHFEITKAEHPESPTDADEPVNVSMYERLDSTMRGEGLCFPSFSAAVDWLTGAVCREPTVEGVRSLHDAKAAEQGLWNASAKAGAAVQDLPSGADELTELLCMTPVTVPGAVRWLRKLEAMGLCWHMDDDPRETTMHSLMADHVLARLEEQRVKACEAFCEKGLDIHDFYGD